MAADRPSEGPGPGGPRGIGASIKRLEAPRLLRGQGRFVDDVQLAHMLHGALLRSPHAHAHIRGVDVQAAGAMPGVVAVFTAEDLPPDLPPIPVRLNPYGSLEPFLQHPLARDRVRYQGEPVALVVAESRYQAEDALEAIRVDYQPLPVNVDALAPPAHPLFPEAEDNVASRFRMETGDVDRAFAQAAHVVRARFAVGRHSGVPLETRGLVARYEPGSDQLWVWGPTKVTHFNRGVLARLLGLAEHRIHLVEPDVGGGFGVRGEFYPEDFLIPYAAMQLGRPVKWIEDRLENLVACNHSRQQFYRMALALDQEGTILGAEVELVNDQGGYIRTHGIIVPELAAALFPGPYRIPNYRCQVRCVLTNKTPTGTYRAPGRFEAHSARERLLDRAARQLGMDPGTLRLRNLIRPDEMPYRVGTHSLGEAIVYDSGDYPYALEEVLRVSGYRQRRREQERARAAGSGPLIGLGLSCFVEKTGLGPFEGARVEVDPSGHVVVSTGAASVGQGLETVLAQIAGEALCFPPEAIRVLHGDTDLLPYGVGSFASRATVMAGNAVSQAAAQVREKILQLAARLLDAPRERLVLAQGRVHPQGEPERALSFAQLAQAASPRHTLPGEEPGLAATVYFQNEQMTYAHGALVAEVAVDPETGVVTPRQVWIVYDVGRAVNPRLVTGQVEGAAVQGLGGALLEEFIYSQDGQLLSGSFMDYLLPTATDAPALHLVRLERSPSRLNPLGLKGAGEAGISGMGGALVNAVADALGPAGEQVDRLPMTPQDVWRWLQAARPEEAKDRG